MRKPDALNAASSSRRHQPHNATYIQLAFPNVAFISCDAASVALAAIVEASTLHSARPLILPRIGHLSTRRHELSAVPNTTETR